MSIIPLRKKRILIGIPSMDMVHADFAMSLGVIMYHAASLKGYEVSIINQKTSIIQKGRHDLIDLAFQVEADKVLFLDSDMIFPYNVVEVLASAKKDIIGCNYCTRTEPSMPTCRDKDRRLIGFKRLEGISEVGYIATGCLLIDLEVFKRIGKPYFTVKWNEDKQWFQGEDYCFSEQAREAGYEIYCDHDLSRSVQHIAALKKSL